MFFYYVLRLTNGRGLNLNISVIHFGQYKGEQTSVEFIPRWRNDLITVHCCCYQRSQMSSLIGSFTFLRGLPSLEFSLNAI